MARVLHSRAAKIAVLGLIPASALLFAVNFPRSTPHSEPNPAGTFQNPLIKSGPDPWMTYYEGNYYLATTTWGDATTGLTMRKAATIADLKSAPPQRVWQDSTPDRSSNYWAPEFFLLNGPNGPRWYGYYAGGPADCCDNQRIHVVESAGTDPMGPYTYKGRLRDSTDDRSIDPSILQLNGSLYLLFAGRTGTEQRVYIAPMENPWTLAGDRVLLSAPTYSWEQVGRNVNQGPVALQHDGRTFVVYSASYCGSPGYSLGMLSYVGQRSLAPRLVGQVANARLCGHGRRVLAGTQHVLQVARRFGRLARVSRQRLTRWKLRYEQESSRPEAHVEQRRHAQLRQAGATRRQPRCPRRRSRPHIGAEPLTRRTALGDRFGLRPKGDGRCGRDRLRRAPSADLGDGRELHDGLYSGYEDRYLHTG